MRVRFVMSIVASVSCGSMCDCLVCCEEVPYVFGVGRCPAFLGICDGEVVAVGLAFCVCCCSWCVAVSVFAGLCGVILCILVARVNGGVASGLGGALVLSGGCGSNIVPSLTLFARRAEGVLGMHGLELRWGWARGRFYT